MLHCVMIIGQIFLVNQSIGFVNINSYSSFNVENAWGGRAIAAKTYDGYTHYYDVPSNTTTVMIPSMLNKCAMEAQGD